MDNQKRGRPLASRNISVAPEYRNEPDVEKLGRAFIAIAKGLALKKAAEEQDSERIGKGDTVP